MRVARTLAGVLAAGALILVGSEGADAAASPGPKQSVRGGGVTVDVTFLADRADAPAFRVVLDTHSVNPDGYRFEEIVRLRDGRGGEVARVLPAPTMCRSPRGPTSSFNPTS